MALPTIDPTTLALASAAGAFVSGALTDVWKKWRSREDRKTYKDVAHELKENGGGNLRARVEEMAEHCKAAAWSADKAAMGVEGLSKRLDEHAIRITALEGNGVAKDVQPSAIRKVLRRGR